ncbi:MAG: hypothetical protein HC809_07060, partial [Gammaproteobacteria bacterium]|nr:hypothetical protein [Gammaproteobacteria bacterium]
MLLLSLLIYGNAIHAVLPPEPVPNVARIPVPWSPHWVLIHDFAFSNLI